MTTKRLLACTLTLVLVAITAQAIRSVENSLGDTSTLTGWTLLSATLGLYLLSVRKKLLRLRVGTVAVWTQVHIYTGTFASIVFLMHIGWPVRGPFEQCLAGLFAFVAVTGITLAILSRTTPRKLAAIERDYRLHEIPAFQLALVEKAHQTAIEAVSPDGGSTLAEHYQRRLLPFFATPRSWFYRLVPNGIKRRQLLLELKDLERYLDSQSLQVKQRLSAMVKEKDDLDFHEALQIRLRLFTMLHFSLTWSLILLIAVHIVLVFRFQETF